MTTALRIFCWNVNGFPPTLRNINLKFGSLAAFFQHLDADIVCMQEVKLPDAKLTREVVVVEGYQSYWSCSEGKTGYSGVTTWARDRWAAVAAEADCLPCQSCREREGRVVMTDHGSFTLLNVYVPNAGERPARPRLAAKLDFLSALQETVDGLLAQGRQVIAVGDFNIAAEQRDVHDAVGWGGLYAPPELAALTALLGSVGDAWRRCHPDTTGVYTVWNERTSARSFNVGQRIDYALCSSGLQSHISSCEVLLELPPKWSDHAPLLLELQLPDVAGTPAAGAGQPTGGACPMWQQLLKRFQDPSQRSIAAMFKAAKPRAAPQKESAAAAAAADDDGIAASGEAAEQDGEQPHQTAPVDDAPGRRAGKLARLLDADDVAAASDAAAASVPDQQLPQQEQQQQTQELQQEKEQQQQSSGQQAQAQPVAGGHSASRSTGASSSSSSKRPAATKAAAPRGGRRGQGSKASAAPPDPKQPKLSAFFAATSNKKTGGGSQ